MIRPGKAAAAPVAGSRTTSGVAEKATKMREEIRASLDKEIDASNRRIEKILAGTTGDRKTPQAGPFKGYATCPLCSGSGKLGDDRSCPQCSGSGYVNWNA